MNTKSNSMASKANISSDKIDALNKAEEARAHAASGSMASKANLVKDFNERNNTIIGGLKSWILSNLEEKLLMMQSQMHWLSLGTTSDQIEYEVIEKGSSTVFLVLAAKMQSSRLQRSLHRKMLSKDFLTQKFLIRWNLEVEILITNVLMRSRV